MSQKIIEVSKKGKAAISVSIRKWERVVKAWELNEINRTSPQDKLGFGVKGCGLCSQYNKTTWGRVVPQTATTAQSTLIQVKGAVTVHPMRTTVGLQRSTSPRKNSTTSATSTPAVLLCRGYV